MHQVSGCSLTPTARFVNHSSLRSDLLKGVTRVVVKLGADRALRGATPRHGGGGDGTADVVHELAAGTPLS